MRLHRERTLSDSSRAGAWAEGEARRLRRRFFQRNWVLVSGISLGMIAPSLVVAFLFSDGVQRGFVLGAAATLSTVVPAMAVAVMSGSANATMGAWAEGWTAQELRHVAGTGTHVAHHFGLGVGDMDHLIVGPQGVFVLETKWSARDWTDPKRDRRVFQALAQVEQQAKQLRLWLKPAGVQHVRPVVVLWGGAASSLDGHEGWSLDSPSGTSLVQGQKLQQWLRRTTSSPLSQEQVRRAWSQINDQAARRDAVEPPGPRSVQSLFGEFAACVAAALVALVLPAMVSSEGPSLALVAAGLLAAALALRRRSRTRWVGLALAVPAALWLLLVAADALL